jgi:hypothetical protein
MTPVPTDEVQNPLKHLRTAPQLVADLPADSELRDRDLVLKINDLRRIGTASSGRYLALE